jgi:outer membrane protein, heavy metal efflux system
LREQSECALSHEMRDRYADTVRLSQARFRAGEISETELRKIELEGLKYQNRALDADMELGQARAQLAARLGLRGAEELGATVEEPQRDMARGSLDALVSKAVTDRPDMRALREAKTLSDAMVTRERREVLPDLTVGLSYTHSGFLASGDNPNSLGMTLSVPLPVFDRNRAAIGRAELEVRRTDNEIARLDIQIRHEIAKAFRQYEWSVARLEVFEQGRMLERAEKALQVAERSYRTGASSLLELLEAERTYLETKADYVLARGERSRAVFDLSFALGSQGK